MSSRRARIAPTLRGAGNTPACPKCGTNEHVVRFWHGKQKLWICSVHFRPKSTKLTEQSLKDRILHRPLIEDDFDIREILPNRAARRAGRKGKR